MVKDEVSGRCRSGVRSLKEASWPLLRRRLTVFRVRGGASMFAGDGEHADVVRMPAWCAGRCTQTGHQAGYTGGGQGMATDCPKGEMVALLQPSRRGLEDGEDPSDYYL